MPLQVYIYASSASNTWPEYAISRASRARDDAAGKKRNSSRAHNRWGELETSFFVLSSQFRPRRPVLGRQIVETIPIPPPPPLRTRFAGIDGTGSILRVSLSSVEIGHRRMFS